MCVLLNMLGPFSLHGSGLAHLIPSLAFLASLPGSLWSVCHDPELLTGCTCVLSERGLQEGGLRFTPTSSSVTLPYTRAGKQEARGLCYEQI